MGAERLGGRVGEVLSILRPPGGPLCLWGWEGGTDRVEEGMVREYGGMCQDSQK